MRALVASIVLVLLLGATSTGRASAAVTEDIFGAASGDIDEPGSLSPIGNGRFAILDRVYTGRGVSRSVLQSAETCFTGQLTTSEDWALQAPKMSGTHRSTVTIRAERGLVVLQLQGDMEFPHASGSWELVRAGGLCAAFEGSGRYSATFSQHSPGFRLTFDGQVHD